MKHCKKGDHEAPEEAFNRSKKAKDGLQSYCRACQKGVHKDYWPGYYQENQEQRVDNTVQWKKDNPDKVSAYSKKRYETIKAQTPWPVLTDYKEVVFGFYGERCMKCGSEEELTIDHITPIAKGGEHGIWNMQVLCHGCNNKKRELSEEDHRPWPRLLDRRIG
ncbi:HNH endonuclease [Streptomyces sp. B1I3]|uniref:HNH endonuclease n=1 Tax=Streptomyces sp. B1I3 TaxID=3042264 RepID=UPI0027876A34|nr:HNH endonuclease [Streptomyces sp. B1I3]MDQ0793584.1 5-methylcytosine-specific restriction endonuclease McrA [Streptomyces sp. B1I3]